MAKVKYGINGREEFIGVMYETEDRDILVLHTDYLKIDDEWKFIDPDGKNVNPNNTVDVMEILSGMFTPQNFRTDFDYIDKPDK